MNHIQLTAAFLLATSFGIIRISHVAAFGAELTPESVAQAYESQWEDVNAMRIEFTREVRMRTKTSSYDDCSWEIVGEKARVVESRVTSFPSVQLVPDSAPISANVVSDCYYDGEKTYELAEPKDAWPLSEVKLADYEQLRRRGQRANISNRNKHWRFWYSCPIPRYFSIPAESDVLSLPELVAKYDASIVRELRTSQGENLVQLEIRNNDVVGKYSSMFKSWALYISFNVDKNYAVTGYQLSVTLTRAPDEKIITEYTVGRFKRFADSIWLPTTVEYREHNGGIRSSLTQILIRGVSINVPSRNFDDFHFLPGMVVTDEEWSDEEEVTGPVTRVHIWGSDNAPERSFASLEEFLTFFKDTFGEEAFVFETPDEIGYRLFDRRGSFLLFVGACCCLLAFGVLVVYLHYAVKRDERESREAL